MKTIPWLGEYSGSTITVKHSYELVLGKMEQPSPTEGDIEVEYLNSGCLQWHGVEPNPDKKMWASPADIRNLSIRPGDLLIAEGGDVGRAAIYHGEPGRIFQKSLHRARGYEGSDVRYLKYVMIALHGSGWLDILCNKATMAHFTAEKLGSLDIPCVPVEEQRRIADFLDAETARIDQLIITQKSVIRLIGERRKRVLEDILIRDDTPASWSPLGYLTEYARPIMYGIVLPGPNVEDGVPIVKGGDVAAGRLSFAQLNKTTHEIEAGYKRSRLRAGDLVIAIRGSVGEIAVVPEELTGANLTQDAARIAPGAFLDLRWLELTLQTPTIQEQVGSRVTGATIKGINIWDLRRVLIPQFSRDDQSRAVKAADAALAGMDAFTNAANQQLSLLTERRQALITAAVTGGITV